MDKNTKTLLGVAVVAGLGYYLYTQYGKKATAVTAGFANAAGSAIGCPCQKVVRSFKDADGNVWDQCAGGQACQRGSWGGKQQRQPM